MPDIFAKYEHLTEKHGEIIAATGIDPLAVTIEAIHSPTQARIEGHECIMLGSNNYLGLTFDDKGVEAAMEAVRAEGIGTTGSRVANGSYSDHKALERQIAAFYDKKHAMLFTTGYQANVGFISAIAGKDDYLLIDADSHASIYDGCGMSSATTIRFRHNDPGNLAKRLQRLPEDANKLIIVEGIYSMRGDRAPLQDMVEVAKAHNAYIMVDEAHSLGVFGEKGRGLAEHEGVEADIDFILGTFSKSVGTIGGYCVSNHDGMELLRVTARSYMFTASSPPAVIAGAAQTLARVERDTELRDRLWRNADHLYDGLKALGMEVGPDKTPVIGVMMPDLEEGLRTWRALIENGVYVNLALPPATPSGTCLLRCSVSAAHTPEQLDTVLKTFEGVGNHIGVLASAAE
jgi:8-amino-7-oxononanoate synthase